MIRNCLKSEIKRILRFLVIGGLAAGVDLLVAFLLVYLLGIDVYKEVVCNVLHQCSDAAFFYNKFEEVVSAISFFVGFIVSYYGHALYTFKSGTSYRRLFKLLSLAMFNLVIRTLIISFEKSVGIDGYLSIVVSLVIVTVVSYVVSKYWVFKVRT